MGDVFPASFIGKSTSQGSAVLIVSRELYYGCRLQRVGKYGHRPGKDG